MSSQIQVVPPGVRALLVEDEPLIAMEAEAILESMGVEEVVCVRSVAEGLQALDTKAFHVAFLDLRLGQESSIPVAQRLAALGVPFGFLTGYQGDAIPEDFKDRPVVPKPFTVSQLGDLLRSLVKQP